MYLQRINIINGLLLVIMYKVEFLRFFKSAISDYLYQEKLSLF
jgi:hypothetical protein